MGSIPSRICCDSQAWLSTPFRNYGDVWVARIPLLAEEGWRDSLIEAGAPGAKREPARSASAIARSLKRSTKHQEKHEASIEARQNRENAGLTTPAAPLRWLRGILLMAHPPLLCEEENAPLLKHKSPKLRNATLVQGYVF